MRISCVSSLLKRSFSKEDMVNMNFLGSRHLIDFESELKDIPEVEKNFSDRHREPPINLHSLKDLVSLLQKHNSQYSSIVNLSREQESEESRGKKRNKSWNFDQMTAADYKNYFLHKHSDVYVRHYRQLRSFISYYCFLLPNKLHIDTPRGDTDTVLRPRVSQDVDGNDHLEVGHKLDLLLYENCASYFLLKEAAVFEIALQRYIREALSNELAFKPFLNPDTCHDLVCFGALAEPTEDEGFMLENGPYRLTGGASLGPFCAYRTGESAHSKFMPERFFACGRRYIPPADVPDNGLYSAVQRTNVHLFIVSASKSDMQSEFQKTLSWLITLYERLGLDFRVCYKRASELRASESLRASIQLYSLVKKDFVDAASLSTYDDFISRRLRLLQHDRNNQFGFTWLVDGVAASVPIILAHLFERSKDKLIIPDCVRPFMYKMKDEISAAYK